MLLWRRKEKPGEERRRYYNAHHLWRSMSPGGETEGREEERGRKAGGRGNEWGRLVRWWKVVMVVKMREEGGAMRLLSEGGLFPEKKERSETISDQCLLEGLASLSGRTFLPRQCSYKFWLVSFSHVKKRRLLLWESGRKWWWAERLPPGPSDRNCSTPGPQSLWSCDGEERLRNGEERGNLSFLLRQCTTYERNILFSVLSRASVVSKPPPTYYSNVINVWSLYHSPLIQ